MTESNVPVADGGTNAPVEVDYLDEDIVTVPGQAFALISFVTKDGKQRTANDKMGLKIRGVFASRPEAQAHIKKLMKMDNLFDIWLVDMYKWLACPPNPDDVADHEYQEEFLSNMVKEYKESQEQAKLHFQERKRAVMEQGLDANLLPSERLPPPSSADGAGPSGTA